jgi:hypothetical protein
LETSEVFLKPTTNGLSLIGITINLITIKLIKWYLPSWRCRKILSHQ